MLTRPSRKLSTEISSRTPNRKLFPLYSSTQKYKPPKNTNRQVQSFLKPKIRSGSYLKFFQNSAPLVKRRQIDNQKSADKQKERVKTDKLIAENNCGDNQERQISQPHYRYKQEQCDDQNCRSKTKINAQSEKKFSSQSNQDFGSNSYQNRNRFFGRPKIIDIKQQGRTAQPDADDFFQRQILKELEQKHSIGQEIFQIDRGITSGLFQIDISKLSTRHILAEKKKRVKNNFPKVLKSPEFSQELNYNNESRQTNQQTKINQHSNSESNSGQKQLQRLQSPEIQKQKLSTDYVCQEVNPFMCKRTTKVLPIAHFRKKTQGLDLQQLHYEMVKYQQLCKGHILD